MPVYNVEKYIAKSIQSVLNQSYTYFELIIVDDGSPDSSIEIAKSFKDSRIKILTKTNGGLSDARNFGMGYAQGEYLYFIDSDDWIDANLLEVCVEALTLNKIDFVIFGYHLDNENEAGNFVSSESKTHSEKCYSQNEKNLDINSNTLSLMGYAWNKMYKTSFIKENNLQFEKGVSLVEDILFNAKVYEASDKILFIDKALYHYINRPATSLIKTFHKNSFELYLKKNFALHSFLNAWQMPKAQLNCVLASGIINGIRYCVNNMFAYKNDLSFWDKIKYLKMMLNHPETQKYVYFYEVKSGNDKLYKKLIQYKATFALYVLCKIKK
jgi:glycosyltransferase involved in cell wall biosynthesis